MVQLILTQVCRGKRATLDDFATDKCTQWQKTGKVPDVTLLGSGRRFKHQPAIGSWVSCAIFCETDRNQWYSPRRELGREAFYPDGVWCHRDGQGRDHYCQKNLCLLPEYEVDDAFRIAQTALDEDEQLVTLVIENEIVTM